MTRRTTLAADRDDLALLESEARRRGVSLAQLLRELVAREAEALRQERRPRFGVFHSGAGGAARRASEDEESPARGTLRS
ncbi:MAG TPA: ribbon-helix-helix protein, CopG family [Gaiellaceae bacterium]|nr:ribbon-helix-helix protein, CopG family [Gaiellaceae bacterium]